MIDPPCKSGSEGNEELSLVPQSDFCGECSKCAQAKARTSRPWTALQPNMPATNQAVHSLLARFHIWTAKGGAIATSKSPDCVFRCLLI